MGLLKNKFFIIFIIVFVGLFIVLAALSENDDDIDEIETKFPLEDYLFQDSKAKEIEQLKKEKEELENKKNYTQIDADMKAMQEELVKQQKLLEMQQELEKKKRLMQDLKDAQGNNIELDENGNPILYDKDGNRIYLDEQGRPYTLDENGNRKYLKPEEKIYSQSGVEVKRDEQGNLVFYDKDGNKVIVDDGKRITTDKNGNKIIEDENGNFTTQDKDGNVIGRGKRDPFGKDKDKNLQDNTAQNENGANNQKNPYLFYDEDGNLIGDAVAVENQKFDSKKASPKQQKINNLLASRFEMPQPEEPQQNKEYGVDSFTNLDAKDEGSNEHKLLRTITADRMIPAFLVRPISSQIGGNVVAQVETNIYGAMGRAVLIPKGSRVIGFYQNNNKIGEYRLQVIWTRIITPQGINIMLTDAKGADVKGYNGLVGEVHSRNFERYGIPLSLSTLSNGLLLAVNAMNQNPDNKTSNTDIANAYMQSQILSGMRQDVSSIIQRIIQEQIKIQPIITIREGSRIFIAPSQDIFIPIPKNNETLARFFNEVKEVEKPTSEEDPYEDSIR